jgi:hypothetical protein
MITETTATGGARVCDQRGPNTASMKSITPINKDCQYNEPGDSLPNRARTEVEQQEKITSHKDSTTEDDSPQGVPEEMGQKALRGTTEALVCGQTTSKTDNQMRQTVETVASQQSPTNPGQHPKRMFFTPQPMYQRPGVEMQGTQKNQDQASKKQDMHMEMYIVHAPLSLLRNTG